MDLTITIPDQRIASLLCTGFEGDMTGHWCRIMDHREPKERRMVLDSDRDADRGPGGQVWPSYDFPLLDGGATICRLDDGETKDTDKRYKPLVLDRAAIERGLKLMQEKSPGHFGDFMAENEDAVTGDVFIQYCLLGSEVYG